ncbi:MAG TPA: helix-turn-helix transcriptional regulator [Longimicrobiales bacterium]
MSEPRPIDCTTQRLIGALTLSRAQLAELVSVSTGTLYSWATGRRRPGPENAARLVEVAERHAELIAFQAAEIARTLWPDGARPR